MKMKNPENEYYQLPEELKQQKHSKYFPFYYMYWKKSEKKENNGTVEVIQKIEENEN